ncbi:hypothetical protein PPERSA_05477 [Pseudocohnilembus persalinus]|uniref:Uncharacterized protein n=1 Tax=Pseudocohnilembus persalinus TaxID=266149 RepID=A0A0V0R844_PSEPJ|nr:hypothetical protein PPERSA_05477 [Pseudocohnilembus persalinus]|eukprot:KRX10657.1 hypothetical protein PPERSA_05477 [Pseudocohnilembus persalinus]
MILFNKKFRILLNEFENIEGNEQRIEQLKAQRDKIASEIKYGIPRENLKQISKDINKIQKELLKIKEYYFIKGINESKLLYPLQILSLDGKINHELSKSEEKILEIYNYLEGLQKQNISQLEKVLKQSENQIKGIQRHLASHLYILDNEQVDKIEEEVQASVRELAFVVKHQEQYQNNLSFVHKCKKTYEGLISHQKEFQIWKSHCRINEFLDKEQTANLISNLSIYPLSQSETDKKNHQKYQQKIEIMIRSLKNEIVYLQNFQDIQNGINLQEIIDQMLKFIEPIQKNYIRMLAALDPAKKPQQIDIEIWLNEMKGESLHTLQTKKRLFEFKEQFFQAIQNYIDVNKDQWEIQVEKLTVQQETAKILNFCQDVLIDMEKACLFLDNLMTQGISTYFGERQQLSKNFDVLEEKFNIQYLNKTLSQYLKYCEEKAKIRQQAREWLQVKKKIITVSYIYDQVKSFSRVMYLIFHSIKNGALHTDKQNQSSIEITIKNIYLIGYSTCQQLRDFASLFEKYSQIETFYKEFDGKICISRQQGRQIFLLYYKFPSMVKEMIEEYDKQREQKLPPQGEIIQDLIERYIDEFQNQYYKLYIGVNLSSYKQIVEDIEMDNFHDCLSLDNLLTNFKEELNDLEKFDGKNFDQLGFTIEKALEQLQKVIENQDKVDHHIQNPLLTNNKIFNSFKENYQKKDLNMWKIILTNLIQNIKGFKNNFYNYEEGLISYEELMKPFLIYQQNQIQKYDNKEIQSIFEDFKQILDLFCGKIQLNNGSQANLLMSDYIQRNNSRKKTKKQTKTDFKIFQNK